MNIILRELAVHRVGLDDKFIKAGQIVTDVLNQPGRVTEVFGKTPDRRLFFSTK